MKRLHCCKNILVVKYDTTITYKFSVTMSFYTVNIADLSQRYQYLNKSWRKWNGMALVFIDASHQRTNMAQGRF